MLKSNNVTRKRCFVFALIAFAVFALLVFLFPYSGDDWAWGSEIGIERLKNHFDNYNGRYAGNLLVMALTRSKLLDIIVTAFSLVCVCVFPKLYSGSDRFATLPLAFTLFLLTPKTIWAQSVVWTAGFSNYIPPILLLVLYLIIVRNIFEDGAPQYNKYLPIVTAVTGFTASLFMENVTIYGLALSAAVIIFSFVKYRRFFAVQLTHLAGCIAGTALMFSNSAYGAIAGAKDGYRSTAISEGLLNTLIAHVNTIVTHYFVNNIPMILAVTVLCSALAFIFIKDSNYGKKQKAAKVSIIINIVSFALFLLKRPLMLLAGGRGTAVFNLIALLAVLAHFCTVFALVIICIEDRNKMLKSLFMLLSIPVLIAPLLVVNPIGPRCFFPPYFIGIIFCVCLFDYITDIVSLSERQVFTMNTAFSAAGATMLIFMLVIYVPIHSYDVKRNEYAVKQAEAGYETVTLCKLPHKAYVWTGDPDKKPWNTRYKLFYGLDQNITFEFLDCKEFDKWASEFDKEMSEK